MALAPTLARGRLFYGWYIVAVGLLAIVLGSGLQAFTLLVFMKPMTEDLGWTRLDFSWSQTLSTITNGLFAPFLGPFLDKHGTKNFMILGSFWAFLGFVGLSRVTQLWQFYLFWTLFIGPGLLCLGNLVVNVAVANWFVRRRGRAIGLTTMGSSIAQISMPPLGALFILSWGWRQAWLGFGLLLVLTVVVPVFLLMQRRPEDLSLRPDGEAFPGLKASNPTSLVTSEELVWTWRSAIRTRAFWLILTGTGLGFMALNPVTLHLVPYLTDVGFSLTVATALISLQGTISMTFKPIWGYLSERRIPARYGTALGFLFLGTAAVMVLAFPRL